MMLQDVLELLRQNEGKLFIAQDIPLSSKSRLRSLQQYRRFVDQKNKIVEGFYYDFKYKHIKNCSSPNAFVYWFSSNLYNAQNYGVSAYNNPSVQEYESTLTEHHKELNEHTLGGEKSV